MTIHQDALDIEVNIVRVNSLLLIPIKRVITYLLFICPLFEYASKNKKI